MAAAKRGLAALYIAGRAQNAREADRGAITTAERPGSAGRSAEELLGKALKIGSQASGGEYALVAALVAFIAVVIIGSAPGLVETLRAIIGML